MVNKELAEAFKKAKSNNEKNILNKQKNEAQKIKNQYVKEFQAKKRKQEELKKKKKSKKSYFKKSQGPSLQRNPFAGRRRRRKPVEIPRF